MIADVAVVMGVVAMVEVMAEEIANGRSGYWSILLWPI
jgi:hypothetical protein